MRPLEQLLSPMIQSRTDIQTQKLNQNVIILMEKIKKQKIDILNKRITPSQVDLVRPEIAESWLRSYNYGLDYSNFFHKGAPIMDKYSFMELARKNDLLLSTAEPYLCQLEAILSHTICWFFLSDDKGIVLRILPGDKDAIEYIREKHNFTMGSVWTEENIGTVSHVISLSLKLPIQLCGPEHYFEEFNQHSCSCAPIYDTFGNIAGTLNIVSPYLHTQNSHSLGLAVSMAWAIQNQFQLALNNELLSVTLEASNEAVITINNSGIIIKANATAKKMFNFLEQDLTGKRVEDILGSHHLINSVLRTGKSVLDVDIEIQNWDRKVHMRSAHPIKNNEGKIYGCVITLNIMSQTKTTEGLSKGRENKITFDKIVGNSPQMTKSIAKAKKFSLLDENILIQGESGTGKEVYARAIHNESRPEGPFIAVNCAAIPKTLIESELFGYEGGAFTGAERQGRIGKIELAHGGTLLLDEIGDMPLELQPVLLRVLEEKKLMRIGGNKYITVDFRLVAATNRNLLDLVMTNQFRKDLYYRLAIIKISIPSLRERGLDIVMLAKYFIRTIAQKQQKPTPILSDVVIYHLLRYVWPGNVRELKNAMLFAVSTADDGVIKIENLPEEMLDLYTSNIDKPKGSYDPISNYQYTQGDFSLKEMEKIQIIQALLQTRSNISEAANLLGMSRSTLYRKVKGYALLEEVKMR